MTPFTMAEEALRVLSLGNSDMMIVIPRRITGRRMTGRRMVLFRKPTVYAEPVCENDQGHTVAYVKAVDVLAYLTASGLIGSKIEGDKITVTAVDVREEGENK